MMGFVRFDTCYTMSEWKRNCWHSKRKARHSWRVCAIPRAFLIVALALAFPPFSCVYVGHGIKSNKRRSLSRQEHRSLPALAPPRHGLTGPDWARAITIYFHDFARLLTVCCFTFFSERAPPFIPNRQKNIFPSNLQFVISIPRVFFSNENVTQSIPCRKKLFVAPFVHLYIARIFPFAKITFRFFFHVSIYSSPLSRIISLAPISLNSHLREYCWLSIVVAAGGFFVVLREKPSIKRNAHLIFLHLDLLPQIPIRANISVDINYIGTGVWQCFQILWFITYPRFAEYNDFRDFSISAITGSREFRVATYREFTKSSCK